MSAACDDGRHKRAQSSRAPLLSAWRRERRPLCAMGRKAREAAKCKLPPQAPRALADVPLAPELLADWGCVTRQR